MISLRKHIDRSNVDILPRVTEMLVCATADAAAHDGDKTQLDGIE